MCEPISLTTLAVSAAGAVAASKLLAPKTPSIQATAPVQAPVSQAAQTPDQAGARQNGANNAALMSTLLTGPSGVDNTLLNLGKSTALGGTLLGS